MAALHQEEAGRVHADVVEQVAEGHEGAGALAHLLRLAALEQAHELDDQHLEAPRGRGRRRRAPRCRPRDVAVVVGAEHVDQQVVPAAGLVEVVGDVGRRGRWSRRRRAPAPGPSRRRSRSCGTRPRRRPRRRRRRPRRAAMPRRRRGRPRGACARRRSGRSGRGSARGRARMASSISSSPRAGEEVERLGAMGRRPRRRSGRRPPRAPASAMRHHVVAVVAVLGDRVPRPASSP